MSYNKNNTYFGKGYIENHKTMSYIYNISKNWGKKH